VWITGKVMELDLLVHLTNHTAEADAWDLTPLRNRLGDGCRC